MYDLEDVKIDLEHLVAKKGWEVRDLFPIVGVFNVLGKVDIFGVSKLDRWRSFSTSDDH